AAERPSSGWISTGIPRPLSATVTDWSAWMVTVTWVQCPASASSTELSTTSNTMWCRPVPSSVSPMYIPGRLRTASRPFKTLILLESYTFESVGSVMCRPGSFGAELYHWSEAPLRSTWNIHPVGEPWKNGQADRQQRPHDHGAGAGARRFPQTIHSIGTRVRGI